MKRIIRLLDGHALSLAVAGSLLLHAAVLIVMRWQRQLEPTEAQIARSLKRRPAGP